MSELPFEQPEEPELPLLRRSQAEQYLTCPAQARYVDEGRITAVSEIAESGEEVHAAIGRVIASYASDDSDGPNTRGEIVDMLRMEITNSRSDLQPDAIAGIEYSYWKLAGLLSQTHFGDIICFDGGSGARSGQLAVNFDGILPHFRFTSEVDFLRATKSPAVLEEWDWKTGNKRWTEQDIFNSFQFQSHWLLVYENFFQRDTQDDEEPKRLEALDVRVLNTRSGKSTWNVRFTADMIPAIRVRVQAAGSEWYRWHRKPAEKAEVRPTREKCRICDAAAICRIADEDVKELKGDPGEFLERTLAIQQVLEARKKLLGAHVEATGEDVVSAHGNAFGFQKPPSNRKPAKSFYEVSDEETGDEAA